MMLITRVRLPRPKVPYLLLIAALVAGVGLAESFASQLVSRLDAIAGAAVGVEHSETSLLSATSAATLDAAHDVALLATGPTYNWLQFGGNSQNTNYNTQESTIGSSNVATLKVLFRVRLPKTADSAPVYLTGVSTPSGVRDLVYVTTKDGTIIALDAHAGTTVWSQQRGPGSCKTPQNYPCYTAAAPAIDPNLQFVYSYGLDGYVHKFQVGDGTEVIGTGWPELVTTKPGVEKVSSSLSTATARNGTTHLYVLTASYGDVGDYQGHLTAIDLTAPTGPQNVFNAVCSNQAVHFVLAPGTPDCSLTQGGAWGRAGPLYDSQTDRTFVATGNAVWDPSTAMWGDSVLALNPDATGASGGPIDSYTPANQLDLKNHDKDLGGANPVALPVPTTSLYQDVAVQAGKDGVLRLINLANLSGQGGPSHLGGELAQVSMPTPASYLQAIRSQPAVWTNPSDQSNWVFVSNENGLTGFKVVVNAGTPTLLEVWHNGNGVCSTCKLPDGNSPLVANGVLYIANPQDLQALDPVTGTLLWHDTSIGTIHWSSPIVDNGVLYVSDHQGHLTAYSPGGIGRATAPGQVQESQASVQPLPDEYAPDELKWGGSDR